MDWTKIKCKISYREKLNKEEKECYFEKIKEIKELDPYEHNEWCGDLSKHM